MDPQRACELVAAERARVEAALRGLTGALGGEAALASQQTGERDAGSELATEMSDLAMIDDLRRRLDAVERAETRIEAGTFGRSVESGAIIPDARLEADPLAERTVEEQARADARVR
jgi:DnaK suppressor protein